MVASLSRNGQILRASTVARVGLNHHRAHLREVLGPTWFAGRLPVPFTLVAGPISVLNKIANTAKTSNNVII